MSRRLLAAVFGGAAVLGASVGIAGGLIAVGVVRRFGPTPTRPGSFSPSAPARPGGRIVRRDPDVDEAAVLADIERHLKGWQQ